MGSQAGVGWRTLFAKVDLNELRKLLDDTGLRRYEASRDLPARLSRQAAKGVEASFLWEGAIMATALAAALLVMRSARINYGATWVAMCEHGRFSATLVHVMRKVSIPCEL